MMMFQILFAIRAIREKLRIVLTHVQVKLYPILLEIVYAPTDIILKPILVKDL